MTKEILQNEAYLNTVSLLLSVKETTKEVKNVRYELKFSSLPKKIYSPT